jgi:hypothetical protein
VPAKKAKALAGASGASPNGAASSYVRILFLGGFTGTFAASIRTMSGAVRPTFRANSMSFGWILYRIGSIPTDENHQNCDSH